MKIIYSFILGILYSTSSLAEIVGHNSDCLLEGTVQHGGNEEIRVKIDRVEKYSSESQCRVRRDRKLRFKLPDDPRVKKAAQGSEVQYRYRTDDSGTTRTELVKIST